MGESELVLDSLSIEEAMRIVAGSPRSGAEAAELPGARPTGRAPAPAADTIEPGSVSDWRRVLREAGGEPAASNPESRPPRPSPSEGHRQPSPPERRPPPPADVPELPPPSARRGDTPRPPAPEVDAPLDMPIGLTVGSDARELFGGPLAHLGSLDEIARTVHDCTRCPLFATATRGVPGEGPAQAEVMVIGEAPGANEDATGRPFVGAAGQLLTKILAAVNLRREDVFICNVMKHRPPGNRNPTPDEVAACSPYLVRQIELIRPKVILALGTFAAQTLLATKLSIGKLRGQVHRYHGVPLVVTYHPAALLRNPGWKRPTWEDVQLARRILDRAARGA
jgi:uracil-DNA glycosylase